MRCALAQTLPPAEILILDDGRDGVEKLLPADARIKYQRCTPASSIGAKRNLICREAAGDYIAHFDDDDWSAPNRLAVQLEGLPIVAGFRNMIFWDEIRREALLYKGRGPNYCLGTSLVYRRDWWQNHKFMNIKWGEDNAFVHSSMRCLVVRDGDGLMVATTHKGCTSPRGPRRFEVIDRRRIPPEYWNL